MTTPRPQIGIVPSILSADFSRLGEQVRDAEAAGAARIQVDVMDGHYVPNISVGPLVIKSIRPHTSLPIEAHLMIEHAELYIPRFAEAGADYIIVHVEAVTHLHRAIQQIRSVGARPGVALNPATPIASLEEILEYIEMVIVMTVNPGFGGQEFIESMLPKIERLRKMLDERGMTSFDVEVDGGIHEGTISRAVSAGANLLVAGSAVYGDKEGVAHAMEKLKRTIDDGR
ncbi:MAG: ribulose-phosphate 3-epimerase [Chloroflexota bacterium]|nr:ribulose-phosphate 3-epimerase [Chloroflexota bacterium]